MIRNFATLLITAVLFGCGGNTKEPVTDTDVATAFIRASLDNDLKTAAKFVLPDDTNEQYMQTFNRMFAQKDKAELDKYKASEVVIDELKPESDSVHTVIYSNTYTNKKDKLKLVWKGGRWLVDLKYTFNANGQ
jgi:transcriptional regulator NrdR family protein